jgi:hypothetical protein
VPFLRTDATYLPRQAGAAADGSDIAPFVTARHKYVVQGQDDWSDFDNLVSLLEHAGMKWLASVHPIRMLPISSTQDVSDFAEVCARVYERYGSALAGVELWNEPNTGSGDMKGTMTPAFAATLNLQGGQALRSVDCPVVMGGVVGGFDVGYVREMTEALPDWARYLTHVTAHCYPGKWAPDTQPSSLPPAASARLLPYSFVPFHQYVQQHFPSVRFGLTEAGYAGTSASNGAPNVHPLTVASEWETGMVQYLRSQSLDYYTHFHVIDDDLVAYNDDSTVNAHAPWHPEFYKEKLGLSSSAGVMKPFAADYAKLAAGLL